MVVKWFPKETRHSGFNVNFTIDENIRIMYENTPKNMSPAKRYLRVLRQANALANVTKSKETKSKARAVVERVSKKLEKLHEGE